ncbi:MAG: hypothetical protein LBF58_00525 [Deltaproteobacteria bacterium]|jgi:hypothetical protein|nr:hypothetical protein [Deltaproteobacteria bacterium]
MINKTLPLLAISLLFLVMVVFPGPVYSQDGTTWVEYSSERNTQTAGHEFTLIYPPDYEKISEFSKEDYIQTFVYQDEEGSGDAFFYLTVGIENLPNDITEATLQTEGTWDLKKLDEFWKTVASQIPGVLSQDPIISSGSIPAVKLRAYQSNADIAYMTAIYFALHKDKLIKLECGNNIMGGGPDYGKDLDLTQEPICLSYFNSLKFKN